jgi:hypothetical protein
MLGADAALDEFIPNVDRVRDARVHQTLPYKPHANIEIPVGMKKFFPYQIITSGSTWQAQQQSQLDGPLLVRNIETNNRYLSEISLRRHFARLLKEKQHVRI